MGDALIRRPMALCAVVLGMLAVVAVPGAAQTGQVKGKVVDAKNQPVEGATVTIEMIEGMTRKYQVKTNKRGDYIQIGLQPGVYRVTAEKENLSDRYERRIGLEMVEINFTLRPGGAGGEMSEEARKKAEERANAMKAAFASGVELSQAGKHDEAIAKFNEVIAQAPSCTECYTNIAALYAQKKDYDQAEQAYKKAIEISPKSADAYNGLATIYNQQKKFDQAAEASAMAQKLAVEGGGAAGGVSASTVFNQGVIAWNAGKIADAKKAFEQAVQIDPKLADAHYWLGMANLNEGNMPEAGKHFDEYLKIAPTGQYAETAKGILSQIKK
jgi:tetratricopeptide (TPR) repeat protein